MILPSQRHLFDIPDEVSYFDCAFMSPLPRKSLAAGQAGFAKKSQPWSIDGTDFFDLGETLRTQMAALVGGQATDFALIPSVSYAMAVIAQNINLPTGSQIIVMDQQFPSNVYPWRDLAAKSAADIITVRPEPGQSWSDAILANIGPKTAMLALAHAHWIDGGMLDLVKIAKAARNAGAKLVLDLTQSLGALPFNLDEVKPDFFAVANYKWLLGPYSTGFLYAAPKHQQGTPLEQCWQSRAGSRDFTKLTEYTDQFSPGATRYDMGERSNFATLPAVQASLAQLLAWGVENIAQTLAQTTAKLAKTANTYGLSIASALPRAPHYLSLEIPPDAPTDLLKTARENGVYFSHRGSRLRITPHLWVNDADLARFDQTLKIIFKDR